MTQKQPMTPRQAAMMQAAMDAEQQAPEQSIEFRALFDPKASKLSRITETPREMILPMAFLKVMLRAQDPLRDPLREPLGQVLLDEIDERMVSLDRKGRLEAVDILKAGRQRQFEDEEEALH